MFVASIFHDLIVQPIFNVLVAIYALLPGHDFGIAIILFTILVRFLMLPFVRKQLHQSKAMQRMQPEIKRIKAASKGDKQKESTMLMELYKERGISPFGSIGTTVVQMIVLLGLYVGLRHVVEDPKAILDNSYGFIRHLPWMQTLQHDLSMFKQLLFGTIDLGRAALSRDHPVYWPAMFLVVGSAVVQYFVSVQLMPKGKDSRSLRQVFKDASTGKSADQSEVSAAVGRSFRFFIPGMIFLFTVNLPAALSLYWFVGGVVAYLQQSRILGQDELEMEAIADAPSKTIIEGEVIEQTPPPKEKVTKISKPKKPVKRRKR